MKIIESILKINDKCLDENKKKEVLNDLSSREASILLSIKNQENITGHELAERNNLSPSRISRIIDNLCSKGYIDREHSDLDRRSIELVLSQKGLMMRQQIEKFNLSCEIELKSRLSEDELQHVEGALSILLKVVNGEYNDKKRN